MDIGFHSALAYWQYFRMARLDEAISFNPWVNRFDLMRPQIELASRHSLTARPSSFAQVQDLVARNRYWLEPPVDVIVSDHASGSTSSLVNFRSSSVLGRNRFFHRYTDDVFIACPELACLQVCRSGDLIGTLRMLSELAGYYTLVSSPGGNGDNAHDSIIRPALPLLDRKTLAAFTSDIDRRDVRYPLRWFDRTRRYMIERSASPRETDLALLLTLPYRYGGFALPMPRLNVPVDLGFSQNGIPASRYFADLYWEDRKVIVEYDSDEFHTGSDRIGRDAGRRNDIISAGYTLVTVTNGQFRSYAEFFKTAMIIAGHLGRKPRRYPDDWPQRVRTLHHGMLESPSVRPPFHR